MCLHCLYAVWNRRVVADAEIVSRIRITSEADQRELARAEGDRFVSECRDDAGIAKEDASAMGSRLLRRKLRHAHHPHPL